MKSKKLSVKFSIIPHLFIVILFFGIKSIVAGGGGWSSSDIKSFSGRGAASVTPEEVLLGKQQVTGPLLAMAARRSDQAGPAGASEGSLSKVKIEPSRLTKENKLIFQRLLTESQGNATIALFNYLKWNKKVSENIIEALIARGADIRTRFEGQETLLHVAALYNHPGAVTSLIDHGLYVNVRNVAGFTPLHVASRKGHDAVVRVLITKKAYLDALDKKLRTPLHVAVWAENELIVKTLINSGAEVNASNRIALVPLCLVRTDGGATTLKEALIGREHALYRSPDDYIEKKLVPEDVAIELGFDPKQSFEIADDLMEGEEESPLHFAIERNSIRLVKLLIKNGADACFDGLFGTAETWTPLHCAASIGNQNIVKALLKDAASITLEYQTIYGETALDLARLNGHAYVAQLLEEAAAAYDKDPKGGIQKIDIKNQIEIEKKATQGKAELRSLKRKIQDCVVAVKDTIERYTPQSQYRSHKKWDVFHLQLHENSYEFLKLKSLYKTLEEENSYFEQVGKLRSELILLDSRLGSESKRDKETDDFGVVEPWKSRIPEDQHEVFKKSIDEQKEKILAICRNLLK